MQSRLISAILGIISASFLAQLPSLVMASLVTALVMLLYWCWRRSYSTWLLCFSLGLLYGISYGHTLLGRLLPAAYEGQPIAVSGVVTGLPETDRYRGQLIQRFNFRVNQVHCATDDCPRGLARLRLKYYGEASFIPGQAKRFTVKLKRPHGLSNPAGFDYHSWLVQQGYSAVGYVVAANPVAELGQSRWLVDYWRWRLDRWFSQQQGGLANSGLFRALLWANRSAISPQQWQLFADTGTSHLMVISGLHIGLVAGFAFFLGRLLAVLLQRIYPERWGAVTALLAATTYAALAGFSLPTQRALVMIAVLMLIRVLQRQIRPGYALLLALIACLLLDPLAATSLSFWLSFTAVAVILLVCCGQYPRQSLSRQALLVQLAIFVGLLPVSAVFLGQVSLIAPLCNLVAVPLFSLVLIPGLLLALGLSLCQLLVADGLWGLLDGLASLFLQGLQWLSNGLPEVFYLQTQPDSLTLAIVAIGTLLLLLPRGLPGKWLGLIMLLPLLQGYERQLETGDVEVTVLDVGQGLSVLVETASHNLLYDLGPSYGQQFSAVNTALLPMLRLKGISVVDKLVISHSDNDHSGNWPLLYELLSVKQLETGEPGFFPSLLQAQSCQQPAWQWDGVYFQYLQVHGLSAAIVNKNNNRSCVLMIDAAGQRFLLPGDIEQPVELALLQAYGQVLKASVLIAPHHGSGTSSSWPFIKQVLPQHVVYAVGYRNRFAHPKPAVMQRYQRQGVITHRSDQHGAIVFRVVAGKLQTVQHFKQQIKRYWLH